MFRKHALVASILLAPASVLAAEPAWDGSAELGTIFTSGNTDTQSINGNLTVKRTGVVWDSTVKLEALTSEEDGVKSKEKYSALTQFDRNFDEHSYLAIVARQDRARFSGYTYQSTTSINYGYRALTRDNMKLDLEAGPGYRRDKLEDTGDIQDETIARLALAYSWSIRDGVSFIENFTAEIGGDQSIYRSETGLQSQLSGSLASKITYKVKYVDEVPADTENTDTEFGVTLVYSF